MARFLPIILVMLLALGVFVIDPARRADPMISAAGLSAAPWGAPTIDGWIRNDDETERLPRAYPPHNTVRSESAAYVASTVGLASEAYLRVVMAQDCRDLLAYDPNHSMLAGGWEPVDAQAIGGFWRTRHTHRSALLDEVVVLDTMFVAPGQWGSDPAITSPAHNPGPGWPGPGAIVQVLFVGSVGENAATMRAEVQRLAENLASELGEPSP